MDFSTFDINKLRENPHAILELGDGVIAQVAERFNYELPVDPQTPLDLSGLVRAIGPNKLLQENIEFVHGVLGPKAMDITADWLEMSGCMKALNRSFASPDARRPGYFDAAIITGGVARWQLRRRKVVQSIDPDKIGEIWLPMGVREMKHSEHALVSVTTTRTGTPATEAQFAREHIAFPLNDFFDTVQVHQVASTNGDEILRAFFQAYPELTSKNLLVIGNAPNTVQAAAQVRLAARSVNPYFDVEACQLTMRGDTFPIGRFGEPASTHQNPISGLTQLVRLAALLLKSAQS